MGPVSVSPRQRKSIRADKMDFPRVMINGSIMATAIPSLGRLAVELQPSVNAFAITEHHGIRARDKYDKYALSSLASGYPQNYSYAVENRLGTHTSVHVNTARREEDDSESMEGLVRDGLSQNVIQQTIDIKID